MIRSTPTSWRTADSLARRKLAPTEKFRAKYSDGVIDMPWAAAPKKAASAAPPMVIRP